VINARFVRLDVKLPRDAEGVRLTFVVEIANEFQFEIIPLSIEAYVYSIPGGSGKTRYLGRARAEFVEVMPVFPNGRKEINVSLDLQYTDIETIERLRNGGRPRFMLDLYTVFMTCTGSSLPSPPIESRAVLGQCGSGKSLYIARSAASVMDVKTRSSTIEVSIDEWLEVLSKLKYKHVKVIEVPKIEGVIDEHLKNTIEHLDNAWKLMSENYEESLNACRKALEELKSWAKNKGLADDNDRVNFKEIYGGDRIAEAVDKVFSGLWLLTNIGSHTGRSKIVKKADIEFVITSIYMLVKSVLENIK